MSKVVLSVEDDNAAYLLLQMAFKETGGDLKLYRASDGEKGIAFLRRSGPYSDAPKPDLVLLNLNLPKISGFEILEVIRSDESLKHIPTVVFSSSRMDSDRAKCLAMGAKHFMSKPDSFDELVHAVEAAYAYAG